MERLANAPGGATGTRRNSDASVFGLAASLAADRRPFAVATVVRTSGSTPQTTGAKLLVTDVDAERPVGTLGGGCVEADAILTARGVIATGVPSLRAHDLNEELAWNTGLVCGGTMWILVEPGVDAIGGPLERQSIVAAIAGGAPVASVTRLRREGRTLAFAGRLLVLSDGLARGTLGSDVTDAAATTAALQQMRHGTPRLVAESETHDWLIEPIGCRPQLVIAGGGHVGRAIANQALMLDFDVTVLEDRPEFAQAKRFPGASIICEDIPTAVGRFPYTWHTYLVVATRGHKLDGDCVLAAVRSEAPYIGLLGSRRKKALIAEMLEAEGVSDERINAIRVPVGLDLGGRSPEEIALSVMAEVTQVRYRATGRPLSTAEREALGSRSQRQHSPVSAGRAD
jgi:xanthine dehydrogenase accessory factor